MTQHLATGARGELLAADYLMANGYRVLERNWRCGSGEIDIVALQGGTVVFVEVKTRRTDRFGHPLFAITDAKLRRLRRLAWLWMEAREARASIRLDAIAILLPDDAPMTLEHVRGIG